MLFQQRIYHRFCLTISELIISTINLPTVTMPVAYVTAFFNDADIKRVTEMVITENYIMRRLGSLKFNVRIL